MVKCFFVFFLLSICAMTRAQSNLYISNGISRFVPNRIIEYGDNIYYLSDRQDTLINGLAIRDYYLSSVNKYTRALIKSVIVLRDTALNRMEPFQLLAISYIFDPATKTINMFSATDVDSSLSGATPNFHYPKRIGFTQLDTDLNVTIPRKIISYMNPSTRYAIWNIWISENIGKGQMMLNYSVRDTNISSSFIPHSIADKFLVVNDTGKILIDEFIGWEPTGTNSVFPTHSTIGNINKNNDGTYAVRVNFDDSICANNWYTLFVLDSNFHLIDTFDYYGSSGSYGGAHPPGKKVVDFGTGRETNFFLPTGSLVRSAWGSYRDIYTGFDYGFYAVGKGGRETGYRSSQIYFPPPSDTGDFGHSAEDAIFAAIYNAFDNRIYSFSSTKSDYYGNFCVGGQANLGQIAAIDTNLKEKWVKYIRPRANHCIRNQSIAPADGRDGVIVSGREYNLADANTWSTFIYHIDSSATLGVNNPESPLIISDQFTLYPNPAADHITIENVLGTGFSYAVINSIGQSVATGEGQGIESKIAVERLPAGVYLVRIRAAGNKLFSLKFVKE